jgi:prepilin-type N-terminal cleavage/methylation domain-containing protein/prepilin-type processing-associated H-X9-DG protein
VKRRGFTLIELLVVIAIIAILAAILFPVFAQAREKAKQSGCQSDQKQGAIAIIMYCGDNEDYMPLVSTIAFSSTWGTATAPDQAWPDACQGYMKSREVLICPSDPNDDHMLDPKSISAPGGRWSTARKVYCPGYHTNLGLNWEWLSMSDGTWTKTVAPVWTIAQQAGVGQPANTVLFVDSAFMRDSSGSPAGGGSFYVDAPFDPPNPGFTIKRPGLPTLGTPPESAEANGWQCFSVAKGDVTKDACTISTSAFGKAYFWHPSGQGFTTAYVDGHVAKKTAGQLVAGWDYNKNTVDYDVFQWDTY